MGMGSTHFFHLSSSPIYYPPINPSYPLLSPNFYPLFLPSSSYKPNRRTTSDSIRRRIFDFDFDFDDDFRGEQRRNWWSDDDDSDDEDDEGSEFGFFEDSNPFGIIQVLKFFGWVVPAVIISNLLGGTGTNSLMMAVVIPLGQTAISLVMDKLAGSPASSSRSSRPGYKSRRRPRPRSRSRPGARKARSRTSAGRGGYQSWRTANSSAVKKGVESDPRFGGWDELDEQVGPTSDFSSKRRSREINGLQSLEIESDKLSRRRN